MKKIMLQAYKTVNQALLSRTKKMIIQIRTVRRMRKNGPSYFCNCFPCMQIDVRSCIIMEEMDVIQISVELNSANVIFQLV